MPLLTTSLITGLAGALTLASNAPIASAIPPVSVVSCDYSSVQGIGALTIPETAPFQTASLRISFVNQAPLTATNVRFAVRYADRTQIIDDAGPFSSGTPITQDFTPAAGSAFSTGSAQCSVESVTFSDGSTWQPA
jgi:hypothetical protein